MAKIAIRWGRGPQPREDRIRPTGDQVAGGALFAAAGLALALLTIHWSRYPVDLAVYREAGRVVAHGGNPYAPSFGRTLRVPLPFTYPPFGALVAVPLALVPAAAALVGWTAVSLAFAYALVAVAFGPALDRLPQRRGLLTGAAAAVLIWTIPMSQTISFGQVNLPLAFGCLLDCTWTRRHRGILVGVATAWKLTPGLFIVYFAVTRQWAAALRAALTTIACELLAALVLPGASRAYWLHLIFDTKRPGDPHYYTNQSVLGAIVRLHLPAWLWPPVALAVMGYGLWRAADAHRQGREIMAVALVGLTILLISPISWQHHAVWIVLVFGVLAAWAETPLQAAAVLAALAVFLSPIPSAGSALTVTHTAPVVAGILVNSFALAYLVLLIALPAARPPERPGRARAGTEESPGRQVGQPQEAPRILGGQS